MAWRLVAKANQTVPRYLRDQKPRKAPTVLYGAEPTFDDKAPNAVKPRGFHAVRTNLDSPLLQSPRVYSNPGPGQGAPPLPVPASAAPQSATAGIGWKHVQAQGRTWKAYTIDLSVARVDVPLWLPGELVWMFSSTNPTDTLSVRFIDVPGDQRNDPIPFHPGNAIGGDPFKGIALSNAAIPGATAVLIVTDSNAAINGEDN